MEYKVGVITGITGQDGSYLAELLLEKEYTVYGVKRRSSTDTNGRILHLLNHPRFNLIEGDVTDATGIYRLVDRVKPRELVNLAAQSHVASSFDQPVSTFEIDAVGVLNILEAVRLCSPSTKVYTASTSELFGDTTTTPQNESTPFNPNSPYAVAKLAAHNLVGLYRRAYGIFACAGILFNHTSPRRGTNFVTRKITKYVAELQSYFIAHHKTPVVNVDVLPLKLGNLDARRDWFHAKDAVRGMWLMLQQEVPQDFVLASGVARTIRDVLETAFNLYGFDYNDYVEIDPKLYRPAEVNLLLGDASKAKKVLGWETTISFEDMIKEMIEVDLVR